MPHPKRMLFIFCLLFLMPTMISAQEMYEWKHIIFRYPSHWEIIIDREDNGVRQVKLVPNDREDVSILLSLFEEFPESDETYWEMPVKTSVSFGLGLALKLAGEAGERAVALHYGSIELEDGSSMSARFTIFPPNTNTFYMLECFHAYDEEVGGAHMGMVMTQGFRGQLIEDPRYMKYIEEAYEIIRSLVIE